MGALTMFFGVKTGAWVCNGQKKKEAEEIWPGDLFGGIKKGTAFWQPLLFSAQLLRNMEFNTAVLETAISAVIAGNRVCRAITDC